MKPIDFSGKTAVITGAASGMGRKAPQELVAEERTLKRLQAEMTIPWIRLGSGRTGHQQRFLGMKYGCAMEFARIEPPEDGIQPTIAEFVSLRDKERN